jgi:peptide/nickel transport system permease protein
VTNSPIPSPPTGSGGPRLAEPEPAGPAAGLPAAGRRPGSARWLAPLRSDPARLVGRRLLGAIPVLFGVTLLSFIVLNLLPGDAASQLLGADATPAQIHRYEIELHLNQPWPERYWHWLASALTGNLGTSLANGQPVSSLLGQRLPVTVELVVLGFIVSLVIAVPAAVLAARRPNGIFDRISMLVSMTGLSMAPYVLALALIIVFAVDLAVLPALGWVPLSQGIGANLRCLVLPAFSIGLPLACFYTRMLRADLLEQMQGEEYIVAAWAKGISPWRVLVNHALRNSMFGLITVVALNFSTLLGGTVIIEQIFGLPGIGQALLTAIQDRDAPVLEGIVIFFSVVVMLAGIAADLLYSVLDPRIRHGNSRD